ncbi:MAG: hypothetical protein ACRDNS_01480, partial [Trebonia sp.]
VTAARWAHENLKLTGPLRVADASARRRQVGHGAVIACGSSERQLPSDKSVDLVLTDPPYFDDVQYAELASLFLATARAVELVPRSVSLDLGSEAVGNHARGAGVNEYRSLLAKIFAEAQRTLKPGGRVVLTYHNTDIRAWWALAEALAEAKLEIRALAVAHAENGSDHAKRGSNAFTSDLVIECRRAVRAPVAVVSVGEPLSSEACELFAAGRAMAACPTDLKQFITVYLRERGDAAGARIHVPTPEAS